MPLHRPLALRGISKMCCPCRRSKEMPASTCVQASLFNIYFKTTKQLFISPNWQLAAALGVLLVARNVMRAVEPDGGSVIFEGNDVTHYAGSQLKHFRTAVHMVYQDPYASLNPRMKIMDIVMEPLNIHYKQSSKEEKIEKVLSALQDVRLEPTQDIASRLPHMLSGGQRQRVALARALVLRPRLIVADEPVSMLDVSVRGEILELMQSLKERFGISYIYITHDLSTARYVGDELAVMNAGKIVEMGPIDRVLSDPYHPYTKQLISAIPEPDPDLV